MRPATDAFPRLVQDHLDGFASEADLDVLRERPAEWARVLRGLLARAEDALARVRATVDGPERPLVLEDFTAERDHIRAALHAVTGEPAEPEASAAAADVAEDPARAGPATPELQLSWTRGHVVAWAAGVDGGEPVDDVRTRLHAAGAPQGGWEDHRPVRLPDGSDADALAAPISSTLGWLVALADAPQRPAEDEPPSPIDPSDAGGGARFSALGTSAAWLGLVAALAVRLAAQGRMVPQLQKATPGSNQRGGRGSRSSFAVRWSPALIDQDELAALARCLPGAVAVLDQRQDPRAFTRAVVADLLHAVCRDAAARVEVPAAPPSPRSAQEVAEAVLARLDGTSFDAPEDRGSELTRALQQWAASVTTGSRPVLVLQLAPPDDGAWHLRTVVDGGARRPDPIGAAIQQAPGPRRGALKAELTRLEALYPPLRRTVADRRGEVVLSSEEAWELMVAFGPVLTGAGFEVRVPPLSRRKPAPGLRLTSLAAQESVVGTQQLTTVRWSAVFDDVELTAQEILELAKQARPLIKARGRWVELDHADLEAAAAALEERRNHTSLTGGDMLRYALGLEGSPLSGGTSVAGEGWAADLLRSARDIPDDPPTRPEGFSGELRGYQADALAWLEFLEGAGLGGCLALDMGLGKTPVLLAHLRANKGEAPALVIAPPAVVGNWAAEARRFVPDLRVVVHHGANRAERSDIAAEVARADVLLTTYGTAVRDVAALEGIVWGHLVLDEAQVIKNATSDTAQQLRRLEARTRIALTGTPIENGLGDLWALLDFVNPGLVGDRASFVNSLSRTGGARSSGEQALRTLNGVLVFRRTKSEPAIAAELPDRIDELDHCPMTPEQIGLYQAVLDDLLTQAADDDVTSRKGAVLAAITALKQICNHPVAYADDGGPLVGRSGKLARLEEIVENVFTAGERMLIFTHFATWGEKLARYLTERTGVPIACYHGGLARGARDRLVRDFQAGKDAGALVLSLKAGGTGLNLTAASHVVLYDRWWNPAVEDQARDRAWRIGQTRTVIAHRLVCPGTVDERVEEVVAGKRRIADLVLPEASSVGDLQAEQLKAALGLDPDAMLTEDDHELLAQGGVR